MRYEREKTRGQSEREKVRDFRGTRDNGCASRNMKFVLTSIESETIKVPKKFMIDSIVKVSLRKGEVVLNKKRVS